jgi:hypothetical protein
MSVKPSCMSATHAVQEPSYLALFALLTWDAPQEMLKVTSARCSSSLYMSRTAPPTYAPVMASPGSGVTC